MLIPGFYTTKKVETDGRNITAVVSLNQEHAVYKGHFPGQPVVPGVIQLQMVKEILEVSLKEEWFLCEVISAKYLRVITPVDNQELQLTISFQSAEKNRWKVSASIASGETVFTKVKVVFEERP